MDPIAVVAEYAAVGTVVGAGYALLRNRKELLTEWMAWGMVWGGVAGAGVALFRALL
jgi:hypothetical protein